MTEVSMDVSIDCNVYKNTKEARTALDRLRGVIAKTMEATYVEVTYDTYATVNGETVKRMCLDRNFDYEGVHADYVDVVISFNMPSELLEEDALEQYMKALSMLPFTHGLYLAKGYIGYDLVAEL